MKEIVIPPFFKGQLLFMFMYTKFISVHLTQFSGEFFGLCLCHLGDVNHRFSTQDFASSMAEDLIISAITMS